MVGGWEPNIFCGVKCVSWVWKEEKILFLERQKFSPFLKIKKIINTKNKKTFSVCQIKNQILICDFEKFEIDFYTEKDGFIKPLTLANRGVIGPNVVCPEFVLIPQLGIFGG